MLISKFNRLIHNKILWGAFAFVISLSMFGVGASFLRGNNQNQQDRAIGELFGEPVTQAELRAARIGTRGFRPMTNLDQEQLKELERQSWQRVALLRKAKTMGIGISDTELAQIIQRDSTFQVNGAFHRNQYERIVRGQLNISIGAFEAIVKQDLIIQKLQRAVAAMLWISPDEINDTLAALTDEFTVALATLDFEALAPKADVSDEEVQTYYDENMERFRTSETRTVEFIQWPVSNYMAEARAEIENEEIDSYYDEHMDEFPSVDTNGTSSYQPLAAVTNDIRNTLATRQARFKAIEASINLSMDIEDEATFASVAAEAGMTVSTSSAFSAYGRIDELPDVDNAFNTSVFELTLDTEADRISEPVPGTDFIYLPRLTSITPAVIPTLEEITADVREQAEDEARAQAFDKLAGELREKLVEAVRGGSSFADAAKALDCDTELVAPFSAFQTGGPGSDPMQAAIARDVIDLKPGEISDVISGYTGTFIAYVKSRTPSPMFLVDQLRPEMEQSVQRFRGGIHFKSWSESVLEEAGGIPESELLDDEDEEEE